MATVVREAERLERLVSDLLSFARPREPRLDSFDFREVIDEVRALVEHRLAQSAIGPLFLLFLVAAVIISVRMLMQRWDELRSDNQLDALLSREAAFLLNNLLFLILDFEVFIGTHFTIFSELLTGEKVTVGPQWYNFVAMPFFLALVLLMGVAPLVAWKRSSIERLGRSLIIPAR